MRIVLLFLALAALNSCTTPKKVARNIDSYHDNYEAILAGKCTQYYPFVAIDSTVRVVTKTDTLKLAGKTVFVNCDSIVKSDGTKLYRDNVPVECPESYYITKHDSTVRTITVKSTSELRTLELELESEAKAKNNWKTFGIIFMALTILEAIALFVLIRRK